MAREVVYRWACSLCDKQWATKEAAEKCEADHPTRGEVVRTEGYRRLKGSTPREIDVRWTDGDGVQTVVAYRRVNSPQTTLDVE